MLSLCFPTVGKCPTCKEAPYMLTATKCNLYFRFTFFLRKQVIIFKPIGPCPSFQVWDLIKKKTAYELWMDLIQTRFLDRGRCSLVIYLTRVWQAMKAQVFSPETEKLSTSTSIIKISAVHSWFRFILFIRVKMMIAIINLNSDDLFNFSIKNLPD